MKKLYFLLLVIFALISSGAEGKNPAQSDSTKISKNFIKVNLTSALIKNYSVQYERVLTRTVSVALSFRMMPESHIPYVNKIIEWGNITDPDALNVIRNTNISNYAVTPEVRFYTGKKKYGRGLYFSLFYRYGHYETNNVQIPYDTDGGGHVTIVSAGNVNSHTGGFMVGAQWGLGRHMCLDWWILGPSFGVSSGKGHGLSTGPLSTVDQQDIISKVNDFDMPMLKKTVEVTSDKVLVDFKGPWAGIRAGISFGVKF